MVVGTAGAACCGPTYVPATPLSPLVAVDYLNSHDYESVEFIPICRL